MVIKHSIDTIEKMRKAHKGKYLGKSWEERYGENIAKSMKKKLSKSMKGRKLTEDTKQLISDKLKGKTPKNYELFRKKANDSMREKHLKSRIKINCANCDEGKYIKPYEEKRNKTKSFFCSPKCQHIYFTRNKHPRFGKKHNKKSLNKISEKSIEMWNKEGYIKKRFEMMHKLTEKEILNMFNSGLTLKKITQEVGVSRVAIKRILLNNGLTEEEIKKNQKRILSKLRKEDWRNEKFVFPIKDTSIEVKIQNFLKQLGIEFFTHQYMKIEHGYQCDILIPNMNLVIECDGNYWHKYPIGLEKDHIRTKELIEKGFRVLRLWGSEIRIMELRDFKNKIGGLNEI